MFFLWDVIFKTGIITRQYPKAYGLKHYKEEEWYAQFLWPIFKSKKEGSELSANGPEVGDEIPESITSKAGVLSSWLLYPHYTILARFFNSRVH